jgi:hypothetical protein
MTIKQQVENILRASRQARNSDSELQIIYMQKAGMNLTPEQVETFKSLPSMETIRRIRQKLQEEGKYPADSEVEQARYNKFVDTKQNINHTSSPEELLEARGYRILPYGQ